VLAAAAVAAVRPQSVLGVDEVGAAAGGRVVAHVWVVDADGTPLGWDGPTGERIGALAFRVRALPAGAVAALVVRRAGVLAGDSPLFEARPASADGVSLVVAFDPARDPLRLGTGGTERQVIAALEVTLQRGLAPGTRIELRLDPEVTVLSNRAGTVSETPGNGWLRLRDGLVVVR
jgi:hypothetical protein